MNQQSVKSSIAGVTEFRDSSGELLHIAYDPTVEGRVNLCGANEPLQVASIAEDEGQSYPAHKHLPVNRQIVGETQECWVVVFGAVKATYYDLSGTEIGTAVLHAGMCSITFRGGHAYEIVEDVTLVYEFKNGPYLGREQDKVEL